MSQGRIILPAQHCWLVRSTRTLPNSRAIVTYYVTPTCWDRSPVHSTIFHSEEDAQVHVNLCHESRAPLGWYDGSAEVFEAVPMLGAISGGYSVRSHTVDLSDQKRYIGQIDVTPTRSGGWS